jgi:membrane associated rhomboid family serine protease
MMPYSDTRFTNPLDEFKRFFSHGSALSRLILINTVIWVLIQLMKVVFYLYNQPDGSATTSWVLHNLAVPAEPSQLFDKPWTLFTYMFLHTEFWHLLFNMLWLYWFGRIFTEFLTSRQLVTVYIAGGLIGGLVYVLAFNVFPVFYPILNQSVALGASASVMAIVTAASFYTPSYTIQLLFFGRIRILYLAIILFVSDFFMIPSGNAGGHLAHIGGALFGLVYALSAKSSSLSSSRDSLFTQFKTRFSRTSHHRSNDTGTYRRPVTDDEYNMRRKESQDKMDRILEKISKGGYDSLTREEKDFLFKTSNKR